MTIKVSADTDFSDVFRVLLPDGEWHQVLEQSFVVTEDHYWFTGYPLNRGMSRIGGHYHGPLDAVRSVMARR